MTDRKNAPGEVSPGAFLAWVSQSSWASRAITIDIIRFWVTFLRLENNVIGASAGTVD